MSEAKENFFSRLLDDRFNMWVARIILTILLGWVIMAFIHSCSDYRDGKPGKILGGWLYETTKTDTLYVTKHDTLYAPQLIQRKEKSNQTKESNTLNNYRSNYGQQAGRDINNFEKPPRILDPKLIDEMLRLNKDKLRFWIDYDNTEEPTKYAKKIINELKKRGGYIYHEGAVQRFGAANPTEGNIEYNIDSFFRLMIYPQF